MVTRQQNDYNDQLNAQGMAYKVHLREKSKLHELLSQNGSMFFGKLCLEHANFFVFDFAELKKCRLLDVLKAIQLLPYDQYLLYITNPLP